MRGLFGLLPKQLLIVIVQSSLFTSIVHCTLTLTASNGTTLAIFDNADFDLPTARNYAVTGTITLAEFYPEDVYNCTLKPVPPDTAVLLIPFDDGLSVDFPPAVYSSKPLNGCRFYDQIILNAGWLTESPDAKADLNATAAMPIVAVFQSARKGDALGLLEMGLDNRTLLNSSAVALTLVNTQDFEALVSLLNKTAKAKVTNGYAWDILVQPRMIFFTTCVGNQVNNHIVGACQLVMGWCLFLVLYS
ncbi:hypothetical protein BC937DRAFT_87861 [Endogone sp. FLAS-F59071]|nr:hypothetical protein BC937DRAFT_87861 [Endogone sp. FLAS-F59071]|eukprot:RUS19194.1 hypothetical protein BC937DRAFT_87861 [Endogone sp. FLAS-F59071]